MNQREPSREIEVKLRVGDVSETLKILKRLPASIDGRVREQNTLYDTPRRLLRRTGRLLRLRTETPAAAASIRGGTKRAILTFKAPVHTASASRYKEKIESETTIHQPEDWPQTLKGLGFQPCFQYEKFRSSFRLSGVHVFLDETPIGTFLELEGSRASIDRAARRLGYTPQDYIRGTYWDLYAADCRRRGTIPRNMLFPA